ncbi:polysaccharide biosynthesis protein [Comamonas serinivorans]|uniref:Polysaccharide biosynthesis protein n=2 Tax=Comamonas serinivorans TaxID=1082851 RepID=A0A1Y0ETF2_9BURK|nr:polysaccharide biosynthesis protein [Comamonas serinivorans]
MGQWLTRYVVIDAVLVAAAWWLAFGLRFGFRSLAAGEYTHIAISGFPAAMVCMLMGLFLARVNRQTWRFVSLVDLRRLAGGALAGGLLTAAAIQLMQMPGFPRSVFLLFMLTTVILLGGVRATARSLGERQQAQQQRHEGQQRLLIVGTLAEADHALRQLKGSARWLVVGIVSPLSDELGHSLQNVPVLGTVQQLDQIAHVKQTRMVLLASPPGAPLRREMLMHTGEAGLSLLTLPDADQWLDAEASTDLRQVQLEDLLGRTPVALDDHGLTELMSGKTVLVTGAGGSIGSELCRQIARFGVARLVCVDVSEYAIYQLEQSLRRSHPHMQGVYLTANVREAERLDAILMAYKPVLVLHAAAYKHVPLMESQNAVEALRTNVLGTVNVAGAAGRAGVQRFVLVSTDKAVNPTNVMGASKRLAERVVQDVAGQYPATQFVAVRFGNVLGSSGSVVPLFSAQIARGGPVTVTHPDIVRYFMTIPEAAQLVLQAGLMGRSRQIFVLDMGEPVKIAELARLLIRLSGKTEQDVPIAFTGLRPGEKLYEELLADDETTERTPHAKLRIAKVGADDSAVSGQVLAWLNEAGPAPTGEAVRAWLKRQVPEYQPNDSTG